MNIQKAHWQADGNSVRLTMPLAKVDTENRIVSGFATLDNIDTSRDIVLASASKAAFENFRGNIRLMHQPIPAGKLVNFREEEYYDPTTSKFYQGIYVDVYVSKGAPEIWEMVLDGTLTGFSIGGNVTDQESQFVKDADSVIRFIKAYDLVELSLVDSPANQLSNIFSITKTAGVTEMSGPLAEVVAENVFWCSNDGIAYTSQAESKDCNACGKATENIGWFESDGSDKTEKVNAMIASFTKTDTVEGREHTMADETNEVETAPVVDEGTPEAVVDAPVEETEEEVTEEEAPAEVVEETDEVTEAAPVEESTDEVEEEGTETPDLAKMFADLSESIQKALDTNQAATEAELTKVKDKLADLDAFATKVEEFGAKADALEEKFNAISENVEGVQKVVSTVEKSVGNKKSGDLGGSQEDKLEKSSGRSLWGGRFFGSVDNI